MTISEADKQAFAEKETKAIMALAVLACTSHPDNKFNPDSKEDADAVETLLYELIGEGDPFTSTFIRNGHSLVMRAVKIMNTPAHEIMNSYVLMKTQEEEMKEFGKYLSNSLIQYIKFPKKEVRDKLRKAAEFIRGQG